MKLNEVFKILNEGCKQVIKKGAEKMPMTPMLAAYFSVSNLSYSLANNSRSSDIADILLRNAIAVKISYIILKNASIASDLISNLITWNKDVPSLNIDTGLLDSDEVYPLYLSAILLNFAPKDIIYSILKNNMIAVVNYTDNIGIIKKQII